MLAHLFEAQRELVKSVHGREEAYGYHVFNPDHDCYSILYPYVKTEGGTKDCTLIDSPQFQDYIRHLLYCCYEEVGEIAEEVEEPKIQEESVDLLHFIIEIGLFLGRREFPKIEEELLSLYLPYQQRLDAFTNSIYLLARKLKNKRWKNHLRDTDLLGLSEALDNFLVSGFALIMESFYELEDLEKSYFRKLAMNHKRIQGES